MGKKTRKCRVCGCSDDDCRGCIERTGSPCSWVEENLCSACADERIVHGLFHEEVSFILDKFDKTVTASSPILNEAVLSKDQLLKVYDIAAKMTLCRINRINTGQVC
jgi:hypothetical protein